MLIIVRKVESFRWFYARYTNRSTEQNLSSEKYLTNKYLLMKMVPKEMTRQSSIHLLIKQISMHQILILNIACHD